MHEIYKKIHKNSNSAKQVKFFNIKVSFAIKNQKPTRTLSWKASRDQIKISPQTKLTPTHKSTNQWGHFE